MRKKAFYSVWLGFLAFQLLFSFIAEAGFTHRVNNSIEVMEQRMNEDNVPSNQRADIAAALRDMRLHVASFVRITEYTIILLNGFMLLMVFNFQNKRNESLSWEV